MKLVLIKAEDVEIWTAMLDFIARTRPILQPTTPPTSVPASFDGTPITHSSASQQGGEQTRKLVERRIFEEIKNCTYRNVGGFFSKYFEGKDWTEQTKKIYRAVQGQKAGGRWTEFPDPPVQDAVVEWLFHFQEEFLSDAGGVYYTSESSKDLTGAEARRQLDIFIKRKSNASGTVHNWKDVRVIGEHKTSNSKDFKPLLLQLGQSTSISLFASAARCSSQLGPTLNPIRTIGFGGREPCGFSAATRAYNCPYTTGAHKPTTP